jgi:hypothetical protein
MPRAQQLLISFALIAVTAACDVGVSQPAHRQYTPVPSPSGSPSDLAIGQPTPLQRVNYVFGDGVSQSTQDLVVAWIDHASTVLKAKLGVDRTAPFTVAVIPGSEYNTIAAYSTPDKLTIDPINRLWTRDGANGSPGIVAHEYTHLWQFQYGGLGDTSGTPIWLYEGMAQYMSYQVLFQYQYKSPPSIEAELAARLRSDQVVVSLSKLERSFPDAADPYDMGYFAVKLLVNKQGFSGLASLCEHARAEGWATAFGTVYHETPEAFYTEFDAYRKTL